MKGASMHDELTHLADLLTRRNAIDDEIAAVIGRPALVGHIGEFIASCVFDIELAPSATNRGHDGRFRSGPLAGRTVNVKYYGKREGILDMRADALPDVFLVLAGPSTSPGSSAGSTRPFQIAEVFAFDAAALVRALQSPSSPPKIGTATSVRKELWEAARVFPVAAPGALLRVTPAQASRLAAFGRAG